MAGCRSYITEEQAAPVFLTALWDTLGVVDLQGNPANQLALPWNLFNSNVSDADFGMANGTSPYVPTLRAQVLALVLQVAGDLTVVASDPEASGVLHATSSDAMAPGSEVFVWQNRPWWSNMAGSSFSLNCRAATSTVNIYTWQGLWKTLTASAMPMQLTGLPTNTTLMFQCQS